MTLVARHIVMDQEKVKCVVHIISNDNLCSCIDFWSLSENENIVKAYNYILPMYNNDNKGYIF